MACKACGGNAINYINNYHLGAGIYTRRGSWGMCFYYRRR